MTTYFRWFARGPDLQAIKHKRLQVFASPRTACWVFDMADRWKPSSGVSRDRVLVAIVFNEKGVALIRDQSKWIRFPGSAFLGDAQHPNAVIVKSNEPGAYGIGHALLGELNACIRDTRLADVREVAKSLGKSTTQVQDRMRLQRWTSGDCQFKGRPRSAAPVPRWLRRRSVHAARRSYCPSALRRRRRASGRLISP